MFKFIPVLFFLAACIASCSHNNLEVHFQESQTGWTKEQVYKSFGPPTETSEDSNFQYYIYVYQKPAKNKSSRPIVWQVRYVFENNKVVDLVEERVPSPEELDELEKNQPKPKYKPAK